MAKNKELKQTLDKLFKNNPDISSYDLESHEDITDPQEQEQIIMVGLNYSKQEIQEEGYEKNKEAARKMAEKLGYPLRIEGIKIKYFFEGKITLSDHDSRFIEIPIGASVGTEKSWDNNSSITGGTLFGPVFDQETGKMYLATNTHVVTNVTDGDPEHDIGDIVTQPLSYDEAYSDQVGKLKELYFADENADIALIEVDIADDDRAVLYGDTVAGGTIGHSPYTGNFTVGDKVEMDGLTTGNNQGEIISTAVTVNLDTSEHWGSEFENVVRTTLPTDFGDSGARVWHQATGDTVGIHFAGCDDYAYHCRGDIIKQSCGVNFDNSPHLDIELEEGGQISGNGLHNIVTEAGEHTVRTDFGIAEIVADSDDGYQFSGWEGPDTQAIEDTTAKHTNIYMDRRRSIKPQFVRTVLLTVQTDGAGQVEFVPYKTEYEVGDEVQLTALPDDGWEFAGWEGDLVSDSTTETIIIEEDTVIQAVFTDLSEYTLTVNTDGEGDIIREPDKDKYYQGETVTVTADPADKWNFDSWQGALTSGDLTVTVDMTDDKQLTALFVAPVELTLDPQGMGEIKVNDSIIDDQQRLTFKKGDTITLEALADDVCSKFDIWQEETGDLLQSLEDKTAEEINVTIDQDAHLQAVFVIKELDMSVWANGKGNVEVYIDGQKETTVAEGAHYQFTIDCGQELELKAAAEADYEFVEWRGV